MLQESPCRIHATAYIYTWSTFALVNMKLNTASILAIFIAALNKRCYFIKLTNAEHKDVPVLKDGILYGLKRIRSGPGFKKLLFRQVVKNTLQRITNLSDKDKHTYRSIQFTFLLLVHSQL